MGCFKPWSRSVTELQCTSSTWAARQISSMIRTGLTVWLAAVHTALTLEPLVQECMLRVEVTGLWHGSFEQYEPFEDWAIWIPIALWTAHIQLGARLLKRFFLQEMSIAQSTILKRLTCKFYFKHFEVQNFEVQLLKQNFWSKTFAAKGFDLESALNLTFRREVFSEKYTEILAKIHLKLVFELNRMIRIPFELEVTSMKRSNSLQAMNFSKIILGRSVTFWHLKVNGDHFAFSVWIAWESTGKLANLIGQNSKEYNFINKKSQDSLAKKRS